jgi:GNAT superfamily N-acetyltransferase
MFEIRLFEERDFESTWKLFHRLSEHYGIGEVPTEQQTRKHVRTNILGEDSDVRIALAFDGPVAIALATFSVMYPVPNRKAQLYLKELFVAAEHRGKGIGEALMKFLAGYALEHGCSRLDWTTETTNPEAMAFYQAIGARPCDAKIYYRLADDELRRFAKGT